MRVVYLTATAITEKWTAPKVLRLVVDRIVVEDTKVVVRHVVPTGPVNLQTERQLSE